ncbi:MAG: hypothetical protein Aurels2KO_56810 [Aureliella sp.]
MSQMSLAEASLRKTLEFVRLLQVTISSWINQDIDDSLTFSSLKLTIDLDEDLWISEPVRAQVIERVLADTLPFACAAYKAMWQVLISDKEFVPAERKRMLEEFLPLFCQGKTEFVHLDSVKELKLNLRVFASDEELRLDF